MTSPLCTVQDGAGAPVTPTNGADVTPAATITVQLVDLSCDVWSIAIVGQDELVAVPALTVDYVLKKATFTGPAAGSALVLESKVDNGKDLNGNTVPAYTTRIGIYTLASGKRVFATNERAEGSASFGWITKVNAMIRAGGGGGSTPTGTGVPHIVLGVQNAAASLVVNADVDPAAAIALSKLAPGTNAQIPVMNAGGTAWVGVALSGAITTDSTGLTAFASGAFGALNITTTGYLSSGAGTKPPAGDMRIPSAWTMQADNGAGGSRTCLTMSGTDFYVGSGSSIANARLWGNASAGLQVNSATYMLVNASTYDWNAAFTITPAAAGAASIVASTGVTSLALNQADKTTNAGTGAAFIVHAQNETGTTSTGGAMSVGGGTGTTSYGLTAITSPLDPGVLAYTFPSDANQTLTPAQSANNVIDIAAGVVTAPRTITVARLAANAGVIEVRNNTTQIITVQFLSGTGIAIPAASSGNNAVRLRSDGTNAKLISSGN